MEKDKTKLSGQQWIFIFIESLGWSGVMVMGYFFTSYYALIQNAFGYTDMQIADLAATMSLTGAFAYLLGGFLGDIVKPFIAKTVSFGGLLICGALVVMKCSYGMMMVVAVAVSIFGLACYVTPTQRSVAQFGTREQEAKIYGNFYALAAAESLIIAPIASKIINQSGSTQGLNAIIFFFCGMMVLSWIGYIVYINPRLKKMQQENHIATNDTDGKFRFGYVIEILKNPNFWFFMIICVITVLSYDLNTFVQPLLASEFDAPQSTIQFVASYANNGTALILAPIAGIIATKLGSTAKTISLSLILGIAASAAILVLPWGAKYMPIAVVIVFFLRSVFSIGKPTRNTLVGESRLPRRARGTALGMMLFVTGIQSTIVAKGAGILTTKFGTSVGYHILYAVGFGMFIFGLIMCLVFAKRLERAKQRDAVEGAPEGLMI